jgi:molybdopterin synthase catalytic subunit
MQNDFYKVEVTGNPLDINAYVSFVSSPAAGAVSTFSGVTRDNFDGKAVVRLEYEAYTPMAVKKLEVSTTCNYESDAVLLEYLHAFCTSLQ